MRGINYSTLTLPCCAEVFCKRKRKVTKIEGRKNKKLKVVLRLQRSIGF